MRITANNSNHENIDKNNTTTLIMMISFIISCINELPSFRQTVKRL